MSSPHKPLRYRLHDYFFPHKRNNYRPHLFSIASITVLVLAVVMFEAGYLVQTKIVFFRTNFLAAVLPGELVALANQDRAINGIAGVTEDPLLDQAAEAAATDMATKGYFAHVSPDGKAPWYWLDSVGYKYSYAGENLAVNFTDSSNVEIAWMNSPTHRANIEKPQYTSIGIGVANGEYQGEETTFVVQFFAAPAVAVPVASAPASLIKLPTGSSTPALIAPAKVLGSQTTKSASVATPVSTNWLSSLLASPLSTTETVFTILFAAIAALFIVAMLTRNKTRHPSVVFGGAFLLLLISGAMLVSALSAGPVLLPAGGQVASVYVGVSH